MNKSEKEGYSLVLWGCFGLILYMTGAVFSGWTLGRIWSPWGTLIGISVYSIGFAIVIVRIGRK